MRLSPDIVYYSEGQNLVRLGSVADAEIELVVVDIGHNMEDFHDDSGSGPEIPVGTEECVERIRRDRLRQMRFDRRGLGVFVEIELVRLVIRSHLVQYLSFSSTLMFPSMHYIDIHTF